MYDSDRARSYWHFAMGEFLPVMYWLSVHPRVRVLTIEKMHPTIPFNRHYEEMSKNLDVEFRFISITSARVDELPAWDFEFEDGGESKLRKAVRFIKTWIGTVKPNPRPIFQLRKTLDSETLAYCKQNKDKEIYLNIVHVPKTAGTAFKTYMTTTFLNTDTYLENFNINKLQFYSNGHTPMSKMWYHRDIFNMATIRDPYERIASAFYYAKEGGANHPVKGKSFHERKWKSRLEKYDSLLDFLQDGKTVKWFQKNYTHFFPLRYWLYREGVPAADYYIRTEQFSDDVALFLSAAGLESGGNIPVVNKTGTKKKITSREKELMDILFADDFKVWNELDVDRVNTNGLDKLKRLVSGTFWGSHRRQVTNLSDIAKSVNGVCSSDETKPFLEQMKTYSPHSTMVLGHGAGMVHMLWMQPKSRVIEIIPRVNLQVKDACGATHGAIRLSKVMGFELVRLPVPDLIGRVDPERVRKEICKNGHRKSRT